MQLRSVILNLFIAAMLTSTAWAMAIEFSSFEKDLFEVTQSRDASARSPLSWSLSAGGSEDDVVTGIATSSDGSIYVAGNFIENIMFGDEGGLQATGLQYDEDFFIAKAFPNGTWDWMVGGGTDIGGDSVAGIALDSNEDIIITGLYCSGTAGEACSMSLGSLTALSKGQDEDEGNVFVAKLSSGGAWQWVESVGTVNDEIAIDVVVDSNDSVFVSLLFRGMLNVGSSTIPSGGDSYSLAVAKLSSSLTWEWAVGGFAAGDVGFEPFGGLCLGPMDEVYFAGSFLGDIMLNPMSLTSAGGSDVIISHITDNGSWGWGYSAGGVNDDWGTGCIVDSNGTVFTTGAFQDTASFGNASYVVSNGWFDLFVATSAADGNWSNVISAGGSGYESIDSMVVTANDDILLLGQLSSSFSLGSENLSTSGGDDILLAMLDNSGNWNWGIAAGGSGNDKGIGIALDSTGSAVSVVNYQLTATFSGAQNTSVGNSDLAIWGYSKDLDGDGITDGSDNCPADANPDQYDHDSDGLGDACDDDLDNDGLANHDDDCDMGATGWFSDNNSDHDGDGCLDASLEDPDDDNDGVLDDHPDICPKGPVGWISNASNDENTDGCEDIDTDGDGLVDQLDNCANISNLDQADLDGDGIGDVCDDDIDGDGIDNDVDSCPQGLHGWVSGIDNDNDADGCRDDSEDNDDDNDGIPDLTDDCPDGATDWTADIATDHDSDGCKDSVEDDDDDADGYDDQDDSCPLGEVGIAGPGQDLDQDGCNDLSEDDDVDNDGVLNGADNCPGTPIGSDVDTNGCAASQRDGDNDGVYDDADQCANTPALTPVDVLGCTKDVSPGTDGDDDSQTSGSDDEVAGDGGITEDNLMYIVAGIVALLVVAAAAVAWLGSKTPAPRPTGKTQPDAFVGGGGVDESQTFDADEEGASEEGASEEGVAEASDDYEWTDEDLLGAGWTPEQIAARRSQ
ncbi:MAG: hypothetical protein CXX80_05075 [Methanobacteriota archaeon]|nr:MAG: hypothetical protein CXX80_05075 [Euryarchaeota archaeon]